MGAFEWQVPREARGPLRLELLAVKSWGLRRVLGTDLRSPPRPRSLTSWNSAIRLPGQWARGTPLLPTSPALQLQTPTATHTAFHMGIWSRVLTPAWQSPKSLLHFFGTVWLQSPGTGIYQHAQPLAVAPSHSVLFVRRPRVRYSSVHCGTHPLYILLWVTLQMSPRDSNCALSCIYQMFNWTSYVFSKSLCQTTFPLKEKDSCTCSLSLPGYFLVALICISLITEFEQLLVLLFLWCTCLFKKPTGSSVHTRAYFTVRCTANTSTPGLSFP